MSERQHSTLADLVAEDGGGESLCDLSRPVRLSAAYVRAIEGLERRAENQSGADKSWVEQARRAWRDYFAKVQRVR